MGDVKCKYAFDASPKWPTLTVSYVACFIDRRSSEFRTGASGCSENDLRSSPSFFGSRVSSMSKSIAERLAHRGEAIELLLVGRRVDAVDRRDVPLEKPASDDLVREEHELLDELIGLA